jgi:hypothetical protein
MEHQESTQIYTMDRQRAHLYHESDIQRQTQVGQGVRSHGRR